MRGIEPLHYRIHLEPDLATFKFKGRVEILLHAGEAARDVTLDCLALSIDSCQVSDGESWVDCPFREDLKEEALICSLPGDVSRDITLACDFTGEINDRMVGFYRSRTVAGGRERIVAVSQFEESDARRAFPCFDHPAKKAVFEITLVVAPGLTAISNMPVKETSPTGDGRLRVSFEKTPRMSTYLLFLGVGEFECIEDPGDVLIRVAATPGTAEKGRYGMGFARKCLTFCEDFYGIPYPLPKLDLISVADFAAGAMENWGAIAFRENLLLHDPDRTSRAVEVRICEVIAHETVHQWFGNLVTPSEWKYLWLNESFATYFGYGVVDHYRPDWNVWDEFVFTQTRAALDRDALLETVPIELPGGEHVVINASTAPIIYNKGAGVLRMVRAYLGKAAFKQGLRRYLKRHAYGCASSRDLWDAFEEVSGKPVSRMMEGWILQQGFPLLEVRREGRSLIVAQRRFSYLPRERDQVWMIPLEIQVRTPGGEIKGIEALLEGREMRFDLDEDIASYKVNPGQRGFYRVRYLDEGNLRELGEMAAGKELSPVDRWGLESDSFALLRAGHATVSAYLDMLGYYRKEDAFLPLLDTAANLYHLCLVLEGPAGQRAAALGREIAEGVLGRIGYDPRAGEALNDAVLRERLLWDALVYASGGAAAFARDRFQSLRDGKRVHPDILKAVMRGGAFLKGREAFDWLDRRFRASEDEQERMDILTAMGSFRDEAVIGSALSYILEVVPSRNRFVPISAMAVNPYAIPFLWDWYVTHEEALGGLHPIHYERVLGAVIPVAGLGREKEVRAFMKEHMGRSDRARDVIKLSLERLEINSRMKRNAAS